MSRLHRRTDRNRGAPPRAEARESFIVRVLQGFRLLLPAVGLIWAGGASACSCYWTGPFLDVAPRSESIVRAKVLGYHGKGRLADQPLAMDLSVLETLKGDPQPASLRVWGDDGHLCRPAVTQFPVGTEWILALNGPGSKPGVGPGPAISVCGEYWLRVTGDRVVGSIEIGSAKEARQDMPLDSLRARLASILADEQAPERAKAVFAGEVRSGESFERAFGPGLSFRLEPEGRGWLIKVREDGRDEDLSRLTPPFHFVPNPREIEGWHFRNSDNTGPNEAGEKNVNAPGEVREFIFSPEVGRTIDGPGANAPPSHEEIDAVAGYGKGTLTILEYRLENLEPGAQAGMQWMRFAILLTWPQEGERSKEGIGAPPKNAGPSDSNE
jgi:hypothetical protein